MTGQPLGAESSEPFHARKRLARVDEEAQAETMSFWSMTLGVLLRPLSTMEKFPLLFSRNDMLGKMAVFYAASFAAVVVAALFMARPGRSAADVNAISEIERVGKVAHQVPAERMDVAKYTQGLTEWGKPFSFRVLEPLGPVEAGKPFTFRILVTELDHKSPAVGEAKMQRTKGHGAPPGTESVPLKPGAQPGEYVAELVAGREGGSSFCFSITDPPETEAGKLKCLRCAIHMTWQHQPGWGRLVLEDRRANIAAEARAKGLPVPEEKAGGGAMAATLGAGGVMLAILGNLVGLLISAAIYTGAARVLGGGGSFLLMLATMAYLTGFSNMLQVLTLATPIAAQMWLQVILLVYGFVLQLFALMKVYDIDLLAALMTIVLAAAAKLLGGAYLLFAALKVLGLAG
jgi:hypothetical protein